MCLTLSAVVCAPLRAQEKACTHYVSPQLCQKIGQMLIVGFGGCRGDGHGGIAFNDPHGTTFNPKSNIAMDIEKYHVGAVILYSQSLRSDARENFIRDRNIQGPKQLAKLNQDLKRYSSTIRQQQGLPKAALLIAIDQEGGTVNRLENQFGFHLPQVIPMALGTHQALAGNDPQKISLARKNTRVFAERVAIILHASHIDINFSPVVDVNVNPLNPVIGALGRSFSDNPNIVTDQATEMINGFHQHQIIPALKHFPGHGSSTHDTHLRLTDVTDTYQKSVELLPYQALIKSGYQDLIMTTHVINGIIDSSQCRRGKINDRSTWCPGTMSKKTLTDVLRQELGFKGIIVSDDMTMSAITEYYPLSQAYEKAINAGVDMFIVGNHEGDYTPTVVLTIAKLIHDGKVSPARIEESYQRIMALKNR